MYQVFFPCEWISHSSPFYCTTMIELIVTRYLCQNSVVGRTVDLVGRSRDGHSSMPSLKVTLCCMIVVPISSLLKKVYIRFLSVTFETFSALFLSHKIVCVIINTSFLRIYSFCYILHTTYA